MGAEADINGKIVRIGSEKFISGKIQNEINEQTGKVYYSINGTKSGVFNIRNHYRDGIQQMADSLANGKNSIHVLTGDNTAERENLENIFGKNTIVRFRQSPQDKLEYIKQIKSENKDSKILMIGDGLNDAGALKQSDVGVAVSENTSRFTPACDAILHDKQVSKLNRFLDYARSGKKVITVSFILSIIYNIVGLSFALQGLLSPLVAAILMPVSSISIVSFVTLATSISARKKRLSE